MNTALDTHRSSSSFARRLVIVGTGLILLFTAVAPEATQPLSFLPRLVFWTLHIGLGLATAVLAALFLSRRVSSLYDWRLIILSGVGGLLLFAPIAYILEFVFPLTADGGDHEWSDRFAQISTFAAVLVEGIELAPSYLTAWILINLDPLNVTFRQFINDPFPGADKQPDTLLPNRGTGEPSLTARQPRNPPQSNTQDSSRVDDIINRLPPIVGDQLVSVSSDLHYLNVVTRKGQAMILGSMQEIEEAFETQGVRVHRSHWVHLDAVVRLRKSGNGWHLDMADGPPIPVSRRKKAEVAKRIGADFNLKPAAR